MKAGLRLMMCVLTSLMLVACSEDAGLDQDGRTVTAAQLENQWLVINYWATWCGPCRVEIPQLNQLASTAHTPALQVLGVNFDQLQGEALAAASREMGIQFRVLAQDPSDRFQLPRSEVLPVTHIIDPQGRLRATLPGEQTAAGLRARLEQLVEGG
jgi:thiol-disulfide isomerase/thioredoxin